MHHKLQPVRRLLDNGMKEGENTLHKGCVHLCDITKTLNNFQLSVVGDTRTCGHF